jgi:hypothetical protein
MAGGRWRLYYAGRAAGGGGGSSGSTGPWQGIGLALSGDGGVEAGFKRRAGSSP